MWCVQFQSDRVQVKDWLMGYPTVALKDKIQNCSLQYRERQRPIVDARLSSEGDSLRTGDLRLGFSMFCTHTCIEGEISPEVGGGSPR